MLTVIAINATDVVQTTINDISEIPPYLDKYSLVWLQVEGMVDDNSVTKIADIFKVNPLALEDVIEQHQRTKIEEYEDSCFSVAKIPEIVKGKLLLQQISLFWGKNFVITFLEHKTDIFDTVITSIKHARHHVRTLDSEYLAYCVLDMVIDSFFPILDVYGDQLDDLEDKAIDNPSSVIIRKIHSFKYDFHSMRRAIWAQREAISNFKDLVRDDKQMWFFIRDCEDHTIQLLDIVENYRDRTSGLMDIYLVSISNRTNQIIKQLTMVATIFMPIGVFAGIYGMNFDRSSPFNMPELGWLFGYEYFWSIVLTFVTCILIFFKRKGWFKS